MARLVMLIMITFLVRFAAEQQVETNYRLMLMTRAEKEEQMRKIDVAFKFIITFMWVIALGM